MNTHIPNWRHRLVARYYRAAEHRGRLRLLGLLKRFLGVDEVRATVRPGVVMELDDSDYVQREILFHGAYEPETVALVERLLSAGGASVFVDIGAHVGQYSLRAARLLEPHGEVVAFEPTPTNAAQFQLNARLSALANIRLLACGVSDASGLARMAQLHPANSGGTAIVHDQRPISHVASLVTMADAVHATGLTRIDVMKIDVEGHEPAVLRSVFSPGVPRPRHLIVELLPTAFDYEGGADSIPAYLRGQGYTLRTVTGEPFDPRAALLESNLWAETLR